VTRPRVDTVYYRRSRFATHLPVDRRYTAAHYWLQEELPGVWRVGFTRFATRMLGDLVDFELGPAVGAAVDVGDEIGTVEGFKAVTSIYSVVAGELLGPNPDLTADITLVESDPHARGWLYRVRGTPDPASLDVHGYVAVLDATIDRMLDQRHDHGDADDADDEG
jgi:glycine cleavage system H protein